MIKIRGWPPFDGKTISAVSTLQKWSEYRQKPPNIKDDLASGEAGKRRGPLQQPFQASEQLQTYWQFKIKKLKKTYLGNVRSWTCKKCVPSSGIHVKDNTFHSQHVTIQVQLHFQSKSVLKHQSSSVFHAGSLVPTRCPNSLCASTPRLLKRWI